jgi:superfamily II DNA/RNA helicase
VLEGRDLCGIAQTGTGKTAAFALPILQRFSGISRRPGAQTCRALVLSPTRELASQIADSFRVYGAGTTPSIAVVYGGTPIGRQRQKLARGVEILVATPGRLLDLIETRSLTLSAVQVLVLDEADRMLDLGFAHALKRIVKLLPSQRQTLLFSATMPRAIAALAKDYLNDPITVAVAPAATTVERIDQRVVFVPTERKRDLLAGLLRDTAPIASYATSSVAASRRQPFTATNPSRSASGHSPGFAPASRVFWSLRTSPRAASTWTACLTSSTSSCRTCPRIMSTESGARHGPALPGSPSPSAAMRSGRIFAISRS